MSFASILRKSASSFAPVASRLAQGGRRHYHYALVTAINNSNLSHKQFISPLVPYFHYSSASKKSSSDESLVRVIDSEIQCAAESDDHERVSFLITIYFYVFFISCLLSQFFSSFLFNGLFGLWENVKEVQGKWGFRRFSRFRQFVYEKIWKDKKLKLYCIFAMWLAD